MYASIQLHIGKGHISRFFRVFVGASHQVASDELNPAVRMAIRLDSRLDGLKAQVLFDPYLPDHAKWLKIRNPHLVMP